MAATTINWFTSSLILALFFLIHAHLKDFSAFAHHQQEIEINGNEFEVTRQNAVYVPLKEIDTDGRRGAVVTRKIRQFGGRKMMQVHQEASVLGGMVNVETTQISGQNIAKEEGEMRELLDKEANKMVKLMHKDYEGMEKPRRKPPVNNAEPAD